MKKFISVLLTLTVLFSVCVFNVSADDGFYIDVQEVTDYPIIIVPGYSGSALRYIDENGDEEHIWGITGDMLGNIIKNTILNIGKEDPSEEDLRLAMDTDLKGWLTKMKMKGDGTSIYPLRNYYDTAEESRSSYIMQFHPDGQYRHEVEIQDKLAEYVGYDNIFNFSDDFRYGAEYCANQLDKFIQEVKAYTGKDKVNIYSLSHGGQVTATYLALYGYKQDVDNAVMAIPAIGGAGIAYDMLTGQLSFREEDILTFIQHGFMWEDDYDWLLQAQSLGFLDDLVNDVLIPLAFPYLGAWGSLWDFMPTELYESAKAELLDETEHAGLIANSDRFHYEILPSMGEKLQECQDKYGMNLTIIAGADIPIITGMDASSDAIITLNSSTGATVAPYGERFADGYTQVNDCDGKNKISPNMTCDLSTAYLPDDTWVISGLYHGMVYKDDFTREIIINAVLNDRFDNVYSEPDYPQFHATSNPSHAIHASFDNSVEGFADKNDTKFVIKNVCMEDSVKILSVNFGGTDISVDVKSTDYLLPGETLELPIQGEFEDVSGKLITATITYVSKGSITPFGQRTFSFTLNNGDKVTYDNDYENVNCSAGESIFGENIENPTIKALVKFINIFLEIFRYYLSGIFTK